MEKKEPEWSGDFESGWEDWSAENGVWEVGAPTAGPENPYHGSGCVGTVLGGNYPSWSNSRLISPAVVLPGIAGNEEIYLRFWQWFSYSNYDRYSHYNRYDKGHVQVSVFEETTGTWGEWQTLSSIQEYSPVWSKKDVDLTAYAGQKIRIAFYHTESRDSNTSSVSTGWYIDNVQIVQQVSEFTGGFEMGWFDWYADRGVWQIGEPISGPEGCYEGEQCAGTVLGGNYPAYTDSRLVSAPIDLTGCSPSVAYLKFYEWFSYSDDHGDVQISIWDSETEQWSAWEHLNSSSDVSTVWTLKYVELSNYVGNIFRIGFLHVANSSSQNHGWFIDNLEIVGPTQIMPTINNVSFTSYIPDPCTSFIDIFASDPCGGELIYTWQLPDGGTLVGTGENMEFIPTEIKVEPYIVRVAASSNATHISSYAKTLKIFTEVLYDLNGDDDIDGDDLVEFINSAEVNATTISRFAEEFGMIACEQ